MRVALEEVTRPAGFGGASIQTPEKSREMNNAMMMQKDGKMCAAGALLVLLVPVAAGALAWACWTEWRDWDHQKQVDILAAFEAGKQSRLEEEQKWYEHGRLRRDGLKPTFQKDRDEEEKATLEPEAEPSKSEPTL